MTPPPASATTPQFILRVQCPDRRGILAAVTQAISRAGGNILDLAQHTATELDLFFLRALVEAGPEFDEARFSREINELKPVLQMEVEIRDPARPTRVGILASRTSHCLYELLVKQREGEINCEFPCVVSNHPTLAPVAAQFGVPFERVPTDAGKSAHEGAVDALLREHRCDLVVLARYMQILSPEFIRAWQGRILNIHHGFLPAFQGAKPYHQAWTRGVKIIGATAHLATEDLDQGPIVAQDVLHVSDRLSIDELVEQGKDIERKVLVQGLKKLLRQEVFVAAGRTFVLD